MVLRYVMGGEALHFRKALGKPGRKHLFPLRQAHHQHKVSQNRRDEYPPVIPEGRLQSRGPVGALDIPAVQSREYPARIVTAHRHPGGLVAKGHRLIRHSGEVRLFHLFIVHRIHRAVKLRLPGRLLRLLPGSAAPAQAPRQQHGPHTQEHRKCNAEQHHQNSQQHPKKPQGQSDQPSHPVASFVYSSAWA